MIANRFNFDETIPNRNYSRRNLLLAAIHDVHPRFEDEASALLDPVSGFTGSSRVAMPVVLDHWSSAPLVTFSSFEVAIIPDPALTALQKIARDISARLATSSPVQKLRKGRAALCRITR